MKITRVWLFYILLLLVFGCSSNSKRAKTGVNKTLEVLFSPIDTVAYPGITDITKMSYYYDEKNDKEYLISFDSKELQFNIFDYSFIDSAYIVDKFSLSQNIHAMYVHNMDSIFVAYNTAFGGKGNVFGLINSKGELIERYNFTTQMVMSDIEKLDSYGGPLQLKVQLSDNPHSFSTFAYYEGSLYLSVAPATNYSNKFLYPSMAVATIAARDNNSAQIGMFEFKLSYPSLYKQNMQYKTKATRADYMDFAICKDEYDITNIIVSYPLSDTLERHRLVPRFMANDDIIFDSKKTYMDSTKNLKENPQLYKYDTLVLKDVVSKYKPKSNNPYKYANTTVTHYNSIEYDKFRKLFYRVVNSIGNSNSNTGQYSVIVTDKYLNTIDELALKNNVDDKVNLLATKDGIALVLQTTTNSADSAAKKQTFVIKYKTEVQIKN